MSVYMEEAEWRELETAHRARVAPWVEPRLERRSSGIKHPVDDFLFDYYPFSPNKLKSWHPGHGVILEGDVKQFLVIPAYVNTPEGGATTSLDWLNPARQTQLLSALRILEGTASRAPSTGCFGMHEWAMVYGVEQSDIRHEQVPLRLSSAEIKAAVDSVGLRCTHLDAFRFFTQDAVPLNALRPTRDTQAENEQPGCLHASMDLYKYAFWFSPLVPSSLIADCFELARMARELDMRASPYDVKSFGLEPIAVETPEGRRHYAEAQKALLHKSAPLRSELLAVLVELDAEKEKLQAVTRAPST